MRKKLETGNIASGGAWIYSSGSSDERMMSTSLRNPASLHQFCPLSHSTGVFATIFVPPIHTISYAAKLLVGQSTSTSTNGLAVNPTLDPGIGAGYIGKLEGSTVLPVEPDCNPSPASPPMTRGGFVSAGLTWATCSMLPPTHTAVDSVRPEPLKRSRF